jgi:hypothetical protein
MAGGKREAKVDSDSLQSAQILVGRFGEFRVPWHKSSLFLVGTVIGVGLCLAVLFVPPGDGTSSSTANSDGLDSPNLQQSVAIPDYSPMSDMDETEKRLALEASRARRGSGGRTEKFLPPKLILRPNGVFIVSGTEVKAQLLSGATTGDALVKARLLEAVRSNGVTAIEANSVLLGAAQGSGDRLFIKFRTLITKEGREEAINADVLDPGDHHLGIAGSKLGYYAKKIGIGGGLNFLAGFAERFQDSQGQAGVEVKQATVKNALLNGTKQAALDQSQEVMNEYRSKPPTVEVESGKEVILIFTNTDKGGGR